MSFTINSGTTTVWSCTECCYCSTKRHFAKSDDTVLCILCNAPAQPIEEIEQSTGMSSFKYRQLLDYLEEEVQGVGTGTKLSLDNHFENGDDFLDAAEAAYRERAYERLTAVDGVGEATAERIALGLAEKEGWSGGKAEMKFTLS